MYLFPADEEKVKELNQKINNLLNIDLQTFITLYNQKIIAQKGPSVQEIVSDISSVYKNIKEINGKIVSISKNQIYIDEISNKLVGYKIAISIKEALSDLINNGKIYHDNSFFIKVNNSGIIYSYDNEELEPLDTTKLWNSKNDVQVLLGLVSHVKDIQGNEETVYQLNVSDFVNFDDSWIQNVYNIVPEGI